MEVKTSNNLKIFSFFSGSGFLDLGFERAGFDIEFVNEYFKEFMHAYIYSREKMDLKQPTFGHHIADINEYLSTRKDELKNYILQSKDNGSLVGFIGGPPCPDFSIAGKNKGCDGENGRLSLSYINLILLMQPDFFVFENVKGLLNTKRHRIFFEKLKDKLHKKGYCTTERLINALEYGVPQDRNRIILFGAKRNILPSQHIEKNNILNFPWLENIKYSMDKVMEMSWPKCDTYNPLSNPIKPKKIKEELTIEHWFKKNNVNKHKNARCFFQPRSGLVKMQSVKEGDVSRKSYKRLHRWRYSPTAAYGNNEVHLHPYESRRISAAEAMAIQSMPKEFVLPPNMTLTNMFKTIGNGVPFLVSEGLAKSVKSFLEEISCKE